jgi:hypothetical protein
MKITDAVMGIQVVLAVGNCESGLVGGDWGGGISRLLVALSFRV